MQGLFGACCLLIQAQKEEELKYAGGEVRTRAFHHTTKHSFDIVRRFVRDLYTNSNFWSPAERLQAS